MLQLQNQQSFVAINQPQNATFAPQSHRIMTTTDTVEPDPTYYRTPHAGIFIQNQHSQFHGLEVEKSEHSESAQIGHLNYAIMQYESILQKLNTEFHSLLTKYKQAEVALQQKDNLILQAQQKATDFEETNSKLEMLVSQLRMQLNEASGEIEFNRNFAAVLQRRNTGEEDFNLERETLF